MSRPPRFCPFCREGFDSEETCPDHGLRLVPLEELPGMGRAAPSEGDAVAPYDLRFGRGGVFLGAALVLVGALLPMVSRDAVSSTLVALATTRATNLWTVPAATAAQVAIVLRRRTLAGMRAARAAVPALSLLVLASVAYTLHRIEAGAAQLQATHGVRVEVQLDVGAWIVVAGAALAGLSGALLGRARG